jgi:hypothetical protein
MPVIRLGDTVVSNTVQNGKGDRRRIWVVDDSDWDRAFRRNDKNVEKNRYKRGNRHKDG